MLSFQRIIHVDTIQISIFFHFPVCCYSRFHLMEEDHAGSVPAGRGENAKISESIFLNSFFHFLSSRLELAMAVKGLKMARMTNDMKMVEERS